MQRWRVLGQLHAPATAKRERSVATALLLVLVMGTAQTRALGSWPPPPRFHAEVEAAEPAPQRIVPRRPETRSSELRVETVAAQPGPRARSVRSRELPPRRAPDLR